MREKERNKKKIYMNCELSYIKHKLYSSHHFKIKNDFFPRSSFRRCISHRHNKCSPVSVLFLSSYSFHCRGLLCVCVPLLSHCDLTLPTPHSLFLFLSHLCSFLRSYSFILQFHCFTFLWAAARDGSYGMEYNL